MRNVVDREVVMRGISVIVCDLESSKMRRPKTELGCWYHQNQKKQNKKKLQMTLIYANYCIPFFAFHKSPSLSTLG